MAEFKITPADLQKSAHEYRKMLLTLPYISLKAAMPYLTLRTGVQYKQTVGQINDGSEYGPYDPDRESGDVNIEGRTLETFLGSVIKKFDPNEVLQSVYGSLVNQGEGLKTTEISKAVISAMMMSLSEGLHYSLFNAKRNDAGTLSKDLFNGFDTIAATEIASAKVSVAHKNLFEFTEVIDSNNAVDALKAYYRATDDRLKGVKTLMYIPFSVMEAYEDDYKQTTGAIPYNTKFEQTFLEGSNGNCQLVPMFNKAGSDIIQITTKNNMIVGTGSGNSLETLEVDRFEAFRVTLSAAIIIGAQYESIHVRRILFGKLKTA